MTTKIRLRVIVREQLREPLCPRAHGLRARTAADTRGGGATAQERSHSSGLPVRRKSGTPVLVTRWPWRQRTHARGVPKTSREPCHKEAN